MGSALFARLHALSRDGLAAAGLADAGEDTDVRAAVLLVNDLPMLILRERIDEVLGVDPLSEAGMRRWGAEVLSRYTETAWAAMPIANPNHIHGTTRMEVTMPILTKSSHFSKAITKGAPGCCVRAASCALRSGSTGPGSDSCSGRGC